MFRLAIVLAVAAVTAVKGYSAYKAAKTIIEEADKAKESDKK